MNEIKPEVKEYMGMIGRKGGSISKRILTTDESKEMLRRRKLKRRKIKKYMKQGGLSKNDAKQLWEKRHARRSTN